MADTIKQQLDEIEVQIMSLQRQLRASMDRFQVLYNQVSGSEATTEGYKVAAQAAQAGAEAAQAGAVAAQGGAVAAQAGAEAARDEALGVADTKVDKPTENLPPGQADLRVGAVNHNGQLVVTGVDPAHMFHSGGMDSAWLQTLLAWNGDPGVLLNTGISYQSIVQKPTGAVSGRLPTFGAGQALVDSGVLATSVSTAITQAAGAVRHDTAQALSDAARDAALANIGTGLKYSVLNAVGKKALMRAALLASGQAMHIYLNSTSAFASFALIPAATTPPTLMKSMSPIGLDLTFAAGLEAHSALFRFGVVYGNSGTAGAGAGVMLIAAVNQTTVQVPCSFADGGYGSLTLTCADASTVVIRSLSMSKSTEYLWLRIGARSGGVKPVYVYDYATSAWKLLINCPSTTDGFRHPQFGFVLGAGFGSCHLQHDNLHGSLVYPSAISISDIF